MPVKCPFCGKEYYYDRKICQTCENKANESRNIPENYTYIHYEQTSAFGHQKPDELYVKIASEPKFSDFKPKRDYIWNCNERFKFRDFFDLKYGISQLDAIKKLPIIDLKIFEKEKNYLLIYE
jgi:hypothetical protein